MMHWDNRLDVVLLHEKTDLVWNLFEYLFGKGSLLYTFIEFYELHDISCAFPSLVISE